MSSEIGSHLLNRSVHLALPFAINSSIGWTFSPGVQLWAKPLLPYDKAILRLGKRYRESPSEVEEGKTNSRKPPSSRQRANLTPGLLRSREMGSGVIIV